MFKSMILASGLAVASAGASFATTVSPTSAGALPGAVSSIGGIVFDLVGENGTRVVSQLTANSLYQGFADNNPQDIGTQSGFGSAVTDQLGGGISELAVRVTLDDGDSAPGNFDDDTENSLLVNGTAIGFFDEVPTTRTNSSGAVIETGRLGFANNELDTGFFFTDDSALLSSIFASIVSNESVIFALNDVDPFDNFYDFTQGIDNSLINVGTGPVVTPNPTPDPNPNPNVVPLPAAGWMLLAGVGGLAAMRRRKDKPAV